jgi:hypothetical protein
MPKDILFLAYKEPQKRLVNRSKKETVKICPLCAKNELNNC